MMKSSIQQEDVSLVNIYRASTGTTKYDEYIKLILKEIEGEIDS